MFPQRFFPGREFTARYWPKVGAVPAPNDWNLVNRPTDASYSQVTRSADATYNQVSRSADDGWNQVDRLS